MKAKARLRMIANLAWADLRIGLAKLWLRFPGRVTIFLAVVAFVVIALSLFSSIGLATKGHPVWGASIMIAVLSIFIFLVEPWLACTGSPTSSRSRHMSRMRKHGGIQFHRAYLHRIASGAEPGLRMDILSGLCPWLLAYWVEDLMDPTRQASLQALQLGVHTRTPKCSPAARPRL